jgi:hypothetical protein
MNRRTFTRSLLAPLAGLIACRGVAPLANSQGSPEALATALLAALARRDRSALESLALSEQEFRDYVWPDLPAARPERNLPFSYVWGDLHQKSQSGLATTFANHAGRRYELVGVRFDGARTQYSQCEVRRDTVLTVRDADGVERDLRLFGSSVQQGGAWKVFSYVVD